MIKRTLFISTILVSFAHAGVSLNIEHPRNPSTAKDLYKINCNGKCQLEIKSGTPAAGVTTSKLFRTKIKKILEMKIKGDLPKSKEGARLVMYRIKAAYGNEKLDLVLGYPLSYQGDEYNKYANVISIIEDLKLKMKVELTEKK